MISNRGHRIPSGAVVVVTGAARGQGRAEAEHLVALGCRVVALDLERPVLDGADCRAHDVTSEADWRELAASLDGTRVHGLVNNAGVTWRAPIAEVAAADMARVYAVNAIGPVLGMQALVPRMGPGSSIVNVGSVAAVTTHPAPAYAGSKWALRGLSRTAAAEFGPLGVRVNLVDPGFIETPMTASAGAGFRDGNLRLTPLGRAGTVADVVPVVEFLLGDGAAFMTGAELGVDGGLVAGGLAQALGALGGGYRAPST